MVGTAQSIVVLWMLWVVLLAAALAAPPPAAADSSEEPFVFAELSNIYRFEADGTAKVESLARIRVQSEAGVQQLGQVLVPYVEGRETLSLKSLRVLAEDGTVKHEAAALVQRLPAPVTSLFPLYSDLKIVHITVPAFRPGDVLEYSLSRDVHSPETPGHFWVEHSFQRQTIVELETLVVDAPADVEVLLRDAKRVSGEVVEREGRRVWTWRHSHLEREAAQEDEPGDWSLALSSFSSWSLLGSWYQQVRGDRAQPTSTVGSKAAELTEGLGSPREKLEVLYDFVSTEYRYLGLFFGIGRYQPHSAAQILDSGYGDCKDKHTLLAALARSQGFEVSAVLVGALREELEEEVPSPAQFDHVLTGIMLGGEWVYLDATSGVAPFEYLPPQVRGKRALRVPESGASQLVTLPESLPFESRTEIRITGEVDGKGTLAAEVALQLRGDDEWLARSAFRNLQAVHWLQFAQGMARLDFAATASNLEISELSDTRWPLEVSFEIEAQEWLDLSKPKQERAVVLPSLKTGLPSWKDASVEDGKLELGGPAVHSLSSEIKLPWGFAVEVPVNVEMPVEGVGEYAASYAFDGGRLVSGRRLIFASAQLGPEAEGGYTTLRATVRKDHDQRFRLVREAAAAEIETSQDPAWLYGVGQARIDADPAAALAAFERVVALDPEYPWGWYEVGRSKEKLGDFEGAREAFRQQGVVDPFNRKTFNAMGLVSEKLDDTEGALAAYRRQLENDPLHQVSTRRLGRLLAEETRCEEAAEPLRRALAFDGEDCESRGWLGECLLALGSFDEAGSVLRVYDGCDLEELTRSSALSSRAGQSRLASDIARYALTLSPTDDFLALTIVNDLWREQRSEELVETATAILESQPENADLRFFLSHAYRALGRLPEMFVQLEKVVELEPEDLLVRKALVQQYMEHGQLEAALPHLEATARLAPATDPALSMLGVVLYEMGDFDKAETALAQAVQNDSADKGMAATLLGRLYAGKERYQEAKEMLELARLKAGQAFADQDLLDHVAAQASGSE